MTFVNGVCLLMLFSKRGGSYLFWCIKKRRGVFGPGDFCPVGEVLVLLAYTLSLRAIFVFSKPACGSGIMKLWNIVVFVSSCSLYVPIFIDILSQIIMINPVSQMLPAICHIICPIPKRSNPKHSKGMPQYLLLKIFHKSHPLSSHLITSTPPTEIILKSSCPQPFPLSLHHHLPNHHHSFVQPSTAVFVGSRLRNR